MKRKAKQNGLFVLSVLTLGTAVLPALLVHPEQAQAALTKQQNQKVANIKLQLETIKRIPNLDVFKQVKGNVLKELKTLPASTQTTLKKDLDEVEGVVVITHLKNKKQKTVRTILLNEDAKFIEKEVALIPKTNKKYTEAQTILKTFREDKAVSDARRLLTLSYYKMLDGAELSEFEKAVSLVPENKREMYKYELDELKKRKKENGISFALRIADKKPDKNLIAMIKADVNALQTSTFKIQSTKKIVELEKKQKAFSAQEMQDLAFSHAGSTVGRQYLPTYLQKLIEQKLGQIKTKSPKEYQEAVRAYYGTEILNTIDFLKEYEELNTKDMISLLKSAVSEYEKKTGDTVFRSDLKAREQVGAKVELSRLKTIGKFLPSGEKEQALKNSTGFGSEMATLTAKAVDDIRYEEALQFVTFYKELKTKLPQYKALASDYINKVQDKTKKESLMKMLNR